MIGCKRVFGRGCAAAAESRRQTGVVKQRRDGGGTERGKAEVRLTHSKCGLGGWPGPHFFLAISHWPPTPQLWQSSSIDVSLIIRLYSRADSLMQFTGPEKMNFTRVFRNRSRAFTGIARVVSPSRWLKFPAEETKTI